MTPKRRRRRRVKRPHTRRLPWRKGGVSRARKITRRRASYERYFHALNLMRSGKLSLEAAAEQAGTSPKAVVKHIRPAFRRIRGQWKAKLRDSLERWLRFYDNKGSIRIKVRSSTTASRIGDYHNAMDDYLRTGEISKLARFKGKWVLDARGKRRYFLTDPSIIKRLSRANVFHFESIY